MLIRSSELRSTPRSAATEAALLELLLALHPAVLRVDDVVRELLAVSTDSARREEVECALDALANAGLLNRHGSFVSPTRAAVRCDQLLGG